MGDSDIVVDKLRQNLHHTGDFSIVRRALQPNARRLRGKVRTLVLLDKAPESPAAEQKQKQGVDARVATTRSPRKRRVDSAYNSAASDAGDTEDEKTETETASTQSRRNARSTK
ncbi:hypothetical protein PF003_g15488 [Phytophthora fragariae]|nr:hypothetical protein PF003_g15488 [Phytophthora fragariae]